MNFPDSNLRRIAHVLARPAPMGKPPAMSRPRVSTNLAISADGKISSARGMPSGWTSREDHERLLKLLENAGALMVGRGTFEADRMTLKAPGNPLRCVISNSGRFDPSHPLFTTPGGPIHLLVTGDDTPDLPAQLISEITIHCLTLAAFLEVLASEHQVAHLHCEGGGQLIRALAELDAIDDFHLTLAGHTLFGGRESPTVTGIPGDFLPRSADFEISHFEARPDLGECFLSYTRRG